MATDRGRNATANLKLPAHTETPRTQQMHQIGKDVVRHLLVEGPDIAKAPQVELEALQLDAVLIWHIVDQDRGKVWLARLWTDTGELRALKLDLVVATRLGIRKGIKDGTV